MKIKNYAIEPSANLERANYMGHTWIRADTGLYPARFWEYTLYTDAEYAELSPVDREKCEPLTDYHVNHIKKYNPRLGHK